MRRSDRCLTIVVAAAAVFGAPRVAIAHDAGAPASASRDDGPSPLAFAYTAVPVIFGLTRFIETGAVNDSLRRAGYAELGPVMPSLGMALTAAYANGLVLEPMYRFTIADADEATLLCHQLFLDVGWMVYGRGEVAVFPLLGVGYGNTSLEIVEEDVPPQRFFDVLAAPTGDALLSSSSFLLHAGFAATLWGSGHGDFIGLRTGFTWAPVSSGWKRRGNAVDGGPSPPMTGGYFAATFGFHSPRWR